VKRLSRSGLSVTSGNVLRTPSDTSGSARRLMSDTSVSVGRNRSNGIEVKTPIRRS
jgi:hypothetical protein